jgi:hypothetical protein
MRIDVDGKTRFIKIGRWFSQGLPPGINNAIGLGTDPFAHQIIYELPSNFVTVTNEVLKIKIQDKDRYLCLENWIGNGPEPGTKYPVYGTCFDPINHHILNINKSDIIKIPNELLRLDIITNNKTPPSICYISLFDWNGMGDPPRQNLKNINISRTIGEQMS